MRPLQLNLLGQFECSPGADERISLPTRKAEVLLAYLALAPGLRHPRERLINLLWSDRGEEQARNSLRQALSAMKKALGDGADLILQIDRTTVSIKADLIEIDVHEFERLALEGDYESLATAADLYQGEFLEGISIRDAACQEWLDGERARFKRQFIEILTNLAETQLVSHDYSHAIHSAERLVKQDPLNEPGWRLLMRSYADHGDRNHALMAFKRCSDVLQQELGVEPEAKTLELQQRIKSGNGATTGSDETNAEKLVPATATPSQTPSRGENSILVLPLQNLSDDPEQQYFSDGLTESIIMGLSRFPSLRTHSRHSSFAAGEKELSIRDIGKQFDTRYVVEGSVRRSDSRLRISATLADTRSGEQIWGEQLDNEIENTFALEDQLTRSIVGAIKGKIDATDEMVAIQKPAKDVESYDLLLRGFHQVMKNNPEDNLAGIKLLQQYVDNDDDNDLAHRHLYHGYLINWISAWSDSRSENLKKAGIHIDKALALDPENAFNHACYAEYQMFCREWELAEIHADKAVRLNPNDAETLATVCAVYASLGQIEKALELADACLAIDPFHAWINWITGQAYFSGKRYRDALKAFQNLPNPADEIEGWIAACHERLGDHENSGKHLHRYLEIAQKHMVSFPQTLDEWQAIWDASIPYRFPENFDHPFDALCDAGLRTFVESRDNGYASGSLHTIAVLPFDNLSGDPEQEYFSDGITESIIMNLSLFPGLNVKSRNSSFAFKQQIKSLGEISRELNVDYVVEGSLRKTGQHIRITIQLIEAGDGNQIWGKRYDAEIENLFELEEELSRSIAATVTGQIQSDLQRIAIAKGARDQQAYDLLLSGTFHTQRFNRQDNVIAIEKLNQCLSRDPDNVRAHVGLYGCHAMDYLGRWTKDYRASFNLAEKHIRRALELNPDLSLVQSYYAEFLCFSGKPDEAMTHIDKALNINPNDADALSILSVVLESKCDFEAALEAAERALALDPYHPWAEWELAGSLYHCGRYQDSIDRVTKFRASPGFIWIYVIAAYVKLGQIDKARQALQDFLRDCRESMLSMPQTLDEWEQYTRDNYLYEDRAITQDLIDSLVAAGLGEADATTIANTESSLHSIAVLPFDNLSGDPAQEYFSDGISESIILNLSAFPGLNVKSRNSSFAFKQQIKSLGEISQELEVDYIVEGSIRKTEDRIRVTVQLVEASSGNQVWGKRYDAEIEDLFDLEEDLSRTIAATVTGQIESDLQRIALAKGAADQQAYDVLLEGYYHLRKFTAAGIAVAIEKFDRCLELDPDNAYAHANLYYCHSMNWVERWVEDFEASFRLAEKHARRALALDPDVGIARLAYGEYLTFCKEFDKALVHVEQVLAKNPNDSDALATKAYLKIAKGEYDEALQIASLGCRLDPYHPWCDWELAEAQFYCGLYEECLQTIANSNNAPGFIRIYNIASNIELKRMDAARDALQEYLSAAREDMPSMPITIDQWRLYIIDNAPYEDDRLNERLVDYLVQAGLEEALSPQISSDDPAELPSILVLPFSNLSGDPEQQYFSDGFSESVILNLNSFDGLQVKSRHASFAFQDSHKSIAEIAAEIGVQYIVEGSIRKRGDRLRITVQLAEAANGNQLWGKRYDAALDDLFDLEEEMAQTIAGTISGRIDRQLRTRSVQKPARDLKSYDYLMRAWYHAERFEPEQQHIAIDNLKKCVEIDPDNAEAHAFLTAVLNVLLYENWAQDPAAVQAEADDHIRKALDLDHTYALAHAFMSEHQMLLGNHEKSLYHADKAIELNPALPDGYSMKAHALSCNREHDEAVKMADISLQSDPYHFYMAWNAGIVYREAGQYQKSIDSFRLLPHPATSIHAEIAAAMVGLGTIDDARAEMALYLELARKQIPNYPTSVHGWRQLWKTASGYRYDEDFENFFRMLLQAGLCDDLEETDAILPSIAVLPFENMSGDPEQEYFSDGITSSVILNLGLFKGIRVKSQNSSFSFKSSKLASAEIAQKLDADYLVEGNIRKSDNRVRISVQLIEATGGDQIWGHQYDEKLEDIFSLEQELSQSIASTISGRLGHEIQQSAVRKPARDLKSYDYLMRALYLIGKFNAENMAAARAQIQKCLDIDPENSIAHSTIAATHGMDRIEGWTTDREQTIALERKHFDIALDLDPDNAQAHAFYSEHLQFSGKIELAEYHADRSIELNPNMSEGYVAKADLLTFTGRAEEAIKYADISMQLDPYSVGAGWVSGSAYRNAGRYPEAIKFYRSVAHPPPTIHAEIATCFVGMGLIDEARSEMNRFLQLARKQMPHYPNSIAEWREHWRQSSYYIREQDAELFFDQLLQAGLCDDLDNGSDEIPSIAVLPFENMSGEAEQEHFSDGITADIISTLSKFPHLRTVSRYSTLRYKNDKLPIADIAQQQNARYILEGSVRKSGNHIRVNAELIDSADGQILWNERYDRDLDDLFAVQDEITKSIALAMKVQLDDGEMALHRSKGTSNTKAWELAMASVDLAETYIRQNIRDARSMAMEAIELDPDYAYAWIALGWCYWQEAYVGWGESIDQVIVEAEKANRQAFRIDPDYSEAWSQLGFIQVMKHEPVKAIEACNRAVELEPGSAEIHALTAFAYIFNGDYEQAQKHNQNMLRLCPIRANWYYMIGAQIELSDGNLERAIELYRQGVQVEPGSPLCRFYLINAMMEKGDETAARKLAEEIRALDPEVSGKGLVHIFSYDSDIRERFEANLAKFDLV